MRRYSLYFILFGIVIPVLIYALVTSGPQVASQSPENVSKVMEKSKKVNRFVQDSSASSWDKVDYPANENHLSGKPFWLRGMVFDPSLNPVEKFKVILAASYLETSSALVSKSFQSREGTFELQWDSPGPFDVIIVADGYTEGVVPKAELMPDLDQTLRQRIVLVPHGRLRGRVVDEDNQPISKALVEMMVYLYQMQVPDEIFYEETDNAGMLAAYQAEAATISLNPHASTDEQGYFELTGLPQGPYPLHIRHPQYFPATRDIVVQPGKVVEDIQIVLSREGGFINVRTLDANGHPVPGQAVYLEGTPYKGETDSIGEWRSPELLPSTYKVVTKGEIPGVRSKIKRSKTVNIENRQEVQVDFILEQGVAVTGTVYKEGCLADDVKVGLMQSDQVKREDEQQKVDPLFASASVRTDSNGYFEVEGLPPGTYHLKVRDGNVLYRSHLTFDVDDTLRELKIDLGAACLKVVLKDDISGETIADAAVNMYFLSPLEEERADRDAICLYSNRPTSSKIDGTYSFGQLAFGHYILEVKSDRYGFHSESVLIDNETVDHDIRLLPAGRMIVYATDLTGVPLRHAHVLVQSLTNDNSTLASYTNVWGLFESNDLAPGEYEVIVGMADNEHDLRASPTSIRKVVQVASNTTRRLQINLEVPSDKKSIQ
ncbi:MAG: carboxypeptidase-like regulatory domain-containing protein [Desulfobacteraceae bacterium]|jgi:hypothetical protein